MRGVDRGKNLPGRRRVTEIVSTRRRGLPHASVPMRLGQRDRPEPCNVESHRGHEPRGFLALLERSVSRKVSRLRSLAGTRP